MARIRSIKPEFFRHHDLYQAEKEERLPLRIAFAGLWTACDREGRFRWSPESLKLDCLPYDNLDFSRVLDALLTRGFVVKYGLNGAEYGCIPSFSRHQVINNRERPSEIPSPEECESLTRAPRDGDACPTPLNLDQVEGEGKGKGVGREGKENIASPDTRPTQPPIFLLPTCFPNQNFPVTRDDISHWQSLYPDVQVEAEIRRMIGWLETNQKKTPKGTPAFITRWLGREQNRPKTNGSITPTMFESVEDHNRRIAEEARRKREQPSGAVHTQPIRGV